MESDKSASALLLSLVFRVSAFALTWLCSLELRLPIVARQHQPVLLRFLGFGFGGCYIISDCGQYLLELDICSYRDLESFKYGLENGRMEVYFLHFDMFRHILNESLGQPRPRISFKIYRSDHL